MSLVKKQDATLSAHQFAVFLTCYIIPRDHTVRGLAKEMMVSKSVVTRALDKLSDLGLAARRVDPLDARSIIVEQTPGGLALMEEFRAIALSCKTEHKVAA